MDWLEIAKDANNIMKEELGVRPVKTKLRVYSQKAWDNYCTEFGVRGIFKINELTAHVGVSHHGWISTIFHEYHGHGTYYEHSGHAKNISKDNLEKYYELTEGFAVWMDNFLCERLGLEHIWKDRKRPLDRMMKNGLWRTENLVDKYGLRGMMRHRGFKV